MKDEAKYGTPHSLSTYLNILHCRGKSLPTTVTGLYRSWILDPCFGDRTESVRMDKEKN